MTTTFMEKPSFERHSLRWPTHCLVGLLSAFFLLWMIPFYDGLEGAAALDPPNEKSRVMGMVSIALFGELHINRVRSQLWWTRDTDLSGRRRTKADGPHAPRVLVYPSKTPGLSMLLGGMYWLYHTYICSDTPTLFEATYFARLWGALIPTWLGAMLFYILLLQICRTSYMILTGHFVFLLGTTMFPYALTLGSHSFAGSMLLMSFAALWWCPTRIGPRICSAILAGLGIGLAFSAEYTAVFTGVWLGLFALLHRPAVDVRPALSRPSLKQSIWGFFTARWHLLFALATSLIPVAAVMWYHKQAFGSYWKTPYEFMLHAAFREGMAKGGFLGYLWPPIWKHSFLLFLSSSCGLFFWTPFLIFTFVGLYYLVKHKKYAMLWPMLGMLLWWGMYPGLLYNPQGGWSVGPRYIANLVPFMALLSVWGAERLYMKYGNRVVPLIATTAVWSILHYVPTSMLFPHLPTNAHIPQIDVVLPMLSQGLGPTPLVPISTGWALIWGGVVLTLLCLFLLLSGSRGPRRWWNRVLTCTLLTLAILVLFQLPKHDYIGIDARIDYIKRFVPKSSRWK